MCINQEERKCVLKIYLSFSAFIKFKILKLARVGGYIKLANSDGNETYKHAE